MSGLFSHEYYVLAVRQPGSTVTVLFDPKTLELLGLTCAGRQKNQLRWSKPNRNHPLTVRRSRQTITISEMYRRRSIHLAQVSSVVGAATLSEFVKDKRSAVRRQVSN